MQTEKTDVLVVGGDTGGVAAGRWPRYDKF